MRYGVRKEALLQQSYENLLAYAREQQARSRLFQGERGYVDSVMRGQVGWLEWRNNECDLATLDDVSAIRQLTYPACQAHLTAQRRERLDAMLTFWRAEFRDANGEASGGGCVLHPDPAL